MNVGCECSNRIYPIMFILYVQNILLYASIAVMENVNLLQVNILKDVLDFRCLNCSNMNVEFIKFHVKI